MSYLGVLGWLALAAFAFSALAAGEIVTIIAVMDLVENHGLAIRGSYRPIVLRLVAGFGLLFAGLTSTAFIIVGVLR